MIRETVSALFLWCLISSISCNAQLDSSIFSVPYESRIKTMRQKVENNYYKAVSEGYLNDYCSNIIIDFDLTYSADVRGVMVFQLIEWLEQKNDPLSHSLLERINELYYLEFHRLLASKNINDEKITHLIGTFNSLNKCQNSTNNHYIFRTLLTKIFLSIFTIENSALSRTNKKVSITYALEEIKHDMIVSYQTLNTEEKKILALDEHDIQQFIYVLESETIKQSFAQSTWVPYLLIFVIVSTTAILIALYVPWKKIGYWTRDNVLKPLLEGVSEEHAKAFVKGAAHGIKDEEIAYNMKKYTKQFFDEFKTTLESDEVKNYFQKRFDESIKPILSTIGIDPNSNDPLAQQAAAKASYGFWSQTPIVGRWYVPKTAPPQNPPQPNNT